MRDKRGEIIEKGDEIAITRGLLDDLNIAKVEDYSVTMGPIPVVELVVRLVVPAPDGVMRYALKLSDRENGSGPEKKVHLA